MRKPGADHDTIVIIIMHLFWAIICNNKCMADSNCWSGVGQAKKLYFRLATVEVSGMW